jgi:F420-dependent oxidoreductase-like protein
VRLGLNIGYWGMRGAVGDDLSLVLEAERLGFSVVWAAEAYGSDAVTVLSYLAGKTSTIDLGSAVLQIPARTPTMTAMTAATLDTLSAGRFRLGLGVSGPQVSEGWHGVRFGKPLARTREYVDIVNLALSRKRVQYSGDTYQLPLPDGPGKALHLMLRPVRPHIPIYLAAIGPKNVELAGEIADGWQPVFFAPDHADDHLANLRIGRAKAGKELAEFDISATIPLRVGDDLHACAEPIRPYSALYLGGMGSREQNFYNALAVRMGYADAAAKVQDLFLDGYYDGAAGAVPFEFIDRTSLLGPVERIAERMQACAAAGVTTASVVPYGDSVDERIATLRAAADALEKSGVGS